MRVYGKPLRCFAANGSVHGLGNCSVCVFAVQSANTLNNKYAAYTLAAAAETENRSTSIEYCILRHNVNLKSPRSNNAAASSLYGAAQISGNAICDSFMVPRHVHLLNYGTVFNVARRLNTAAAAVGICLPFCDLTLWSGSEGCVHMEITDSKPVIT
jgi:hypothetical protein